MNIAVLLLKCKNEPRVTTLTRDRIQEITASVAGFLFDQSGGPFLHFNNKTAIFIILDG